MLLLWIGPRNKLLSLKKCFHRSVWNCAPPKIVHVPVTQEQSAVTSLMNPQICFTAVETPQVVGSFPFAEDFAAPMYNQVHQEQIVATEKPQSYCSGNSSASLCGGG